MQAVECYCVCLSPQLAHRNKYLLGFARVALFGTALVSDGHVAVCGGVGEGGG